MDSQRLDFFISYNHADSRWALWIAQELERAGYRTVIEARDFSAGQNFVLRMHEAAQTVPHTIAVLSPNYLAAPFPKAEWSAALVQDPTGEKRKLIPVRVVECDVPGLLKAISFVNLVGLNEQEARRALLAGVASGGPLGHAAFPGASPAGEKVHRYPGAFPSVWNVPGRPNQNFMGREELVRELRSALLSGEPAALTQAITGLGGIGKTQIALAYTHLFAYEYDVVWWVRAEETTTLEADLNELAVRLEVRMQPAEPRSRLVERLGLRLRQFAAWLVAFDNADTPADLAPFIPQGGGHVLITSRNPHWRGLAKTVSVPLMPQPASVQFLLARSGQLDVAAATDLAARLGNLPLALEQVAAFIEEHGVTLREYLQDFDVRMNALVEPREGGTAPPYGGISAVWEISFDRVLQKSAAAIDLLYLCSVLAPEEVPKEMIRRGADAIAKMSINGLARGRHQVSLRQENFETALAALTRHSLVEVRGDRLIVHRLVQAVTRQRMGAELRRLWESIARALVDLTLVDPGLLSAHHLLPHALAAAASVPDPTSRETRTPGTGEDRFSIAEDGSVTLSLAGVLDALNVVEYREVLDRIVERAPKRVVVDMSKLRLIDSSGVGLVVSLYKRIKGLDGSMLVVGMREQPLAIFRLLRLDRVLLSPS